MRITMKGGVWKNSEDEILKAAVMKYGLNNWSRVASLLVRKSTKQCKSRWYEWLDPAVKKTEWTRNEEEKLLHLAKLFPNQWRTIAPIVGRTAHQCLEHYDRLLDQAQGRTDEDRLNDPRRLRPGEIDPHPETKPSRADAVDMDDDEKEMLAEARARLANTRGKKAKRKAREKQLEEARRLAALQKGRELKAVGLCVGRWKRRNQMIDYAREVPFEKQPPKGFYAVGEDESPQVAKGVANFNLQELEGKRRVDEERRLRNEDTRRMKRLMEENLPEAIRAIERVNNPLPFRKKTKLSLQEPQLSENELEEILLLGKNNDVFSTRDNSHSSMLLIQNEKINQSLPRFSSLRTPATETTILLEAQNAVARMTASTPLEGEDLPQLHNVTSGIGATPIHTVPRTPHPLSLVHKKSSTANSLGVSTSFIGSHDYGVSATPFSQSGGTPSVGFDQMSIDNQTVSENSKITKALLSKKIQDSLATLPAPQNEIEVSIPDVTSNSYLDTKIEETYQEDADDLEKCEKKKVEEERMKKLKSRSKVVQNNYPRPINPTVKDLDMSFNVLTLEKSDPDISKMSEAQSLIAEEMKKLVQHDAATYPLPIKHSGNLLPSPDMEEISYELFTSAEELVDRETSHIIDILQVKLPPVDDKDWNDAWESVENTQFLVDPCSLTQVDEKEISPVAKLNALIMFYNDLKTYLTKESAKAKKIESRLNTLTKGYIMKTQTISKSIVDLWSDALVLETDVDAFKLLEENERIGLRTRVEDLTKRIAQENSFHEHLQSIFAELNSKKNMLLTQQHSTDASVFTTELPYGNVMPVST